MKKNVWAVYFSPGGSTKKVVETIACQIANNYKIDLKTTDYTLPEARQGQATFSEEDIVVWGSPIYAGRLPNKMLPFVTKSFQGNGAVAIPVVTYGNRSFGDGLIELKLILQQNGFKIAGAAAFSCQHSFVKELATGRPTSEDLDFARNFANKIDVDAPKDVKVPGTNPPVEYYTPKGLDGQPTVFLKAKPKTNEELCINCGLCASSCPTGAISKEKVSLVEGVCIKCNACVNKCPVSAKFFEDAAFLSHQAMLKKNFREKKENLGFF